uniref:Uncharacterized protein n=1 Tax=Arundo donax TaxID=35708 RepID=A0A0A8YJP6_ARUDO
MITSLKKDVGQMMQNKRTISRWILLPENHLKSLRYA